MPFRGNRLDEISLITSYHAGRNGFAELGIGRTVIHNPGARCAFAPPFARTYYLGAEMRADRPDLVGFKAGVQQSSFLALGLQYIHYLEWPRGEAAANPSTSSGPRTAEVLRPELGFGGTRFKLTYAYNVRLTKPRIEGVNTHMLSLSYAFHVLRLLGDDRSPRSQ